MTLTNYFEQYYDVLSDGDLNLLEQFYCTGSTLLKMNQQQFGALRAKSTYTIILQEAVLLAKKDYLLVVQDTIKLDIMKGEKEVTQVSSNIHTLIPDGNAWKIHSTSTLPKVVN